MRGIRVLIILGLGIVFAIYSSNQRRSSSSAPAPSTPAGRAQIIATPEQAERGKLIDAGNLYADSVEFEFAVYLPVDTKTDPAALLKKWTTEKYKSLQFVEKDDAKQPALATCRIAPVTIEKYKAPDAETLKYLSNGLSDTDKKALMASKRVIVVDFKAGHAQALAALKDSQALMLDLAKETQGYLWDEAARISMSRAAWQSKRVEAWKDVLPNLSSHVEVHFYQTDEFCRLVTLGMGKFGLPDIAIEDAARSDATSLLSTVNLVCQTIAEKGRIETNGTLNVDVSALKNSELRAQLIKSYRKGATGIAAVQLAWVPAQKGDAQNRLAEIRFPASLGTSVQERHVALIKQLFGGEDAIKYIKSDSEELVAAKAHAKEKIKEEFKKWKAGLPIGEHIDVKAPFKTPTDGVEWMWIEVTQWKDDGTIEGVLGNDPFDVPNLKMGARVRVTQDSLFDYIHIYADKHTEGNETGEIIQKMEDAGK
jgi:uncharacterized protein YegJ (DUF2314 family)